MVSPVGMHDTLATGSVLEGSGVDLEGVLGTVLPAGEHDTAPTGLDWMVLEFSGSELIRFTAASRLGSTAASSEDS